MDIEQIVTTVSVVVTASSFIIRGISAIWDVTPGTPETEVFGTLTKILHKVQKVLSPIAGDSAKKELKRKGG